MLLHDQDQKLLTGPGPDDYLPIGLAFSFFLLWTLGAMGQPVGMVRLMACRDTPTLRRSLFLIGIYYALIYFPLVITFVCAVLCILRNTSPSRMTSCRRWPCG